MVFWKASYCLFWPIFQTTENRVVLNGKHSSWSNIKAGLPEGSILGPLFFFLYINDLTENLDSHWKLIEDDTSFLSRS